MADDDVLLTLGTAVLTNSASVVGAVRIGPYETGPVLAEDEMSVTRLGVDTKTGAMVLIQSVELCRTGSDSTYDEAVEDSSRRPVVVSAAAVAWLTGKEFRQHLVIVNRMRHSHIAPYCAVLVSPLRLHFVTLYAAGGPLMNAVRTRFLERYRADEREDCSDNDDESDHAGTGARWFFRSRMSEDEARFYFQQLVAAIRYAHEGSGIAHGNLSLDCLLLDGPLPSELSYAEIDKFSYQRRPRLRVGSWGLAAVRAHSRLAETLFNAEQLSSWVEGVRSGSESLERCVQRTNFVAPELLVPCIEVSGAAASAATATTTTTATASPTGQATIVAVTDDALKKADVWSCGVILYAMLCGTLPFVLQQHANGDEALLAGDGSAEAPIVWTSVSALQHALGELVRRMNFASFSFPTHVSRGVRGARHLIANMMVPDAAKRYSWDQVVSHPWFDVRVEKTLFPIRTSSGPVSGAASSPSAASLL